MVQVPQCRYVDLSVGGKVVWRCTVVAMRQSATDWWVGAAEEDPLCT